MHAALEAFARQDLQFEDTTDPAEILRWAFSAFPSDRIAVTTAFGMEGCVLLDLLERSVAIEQTVRVTFVDTGFLFPETHALRVRLAERYPRLRFEAAASDLDPDAQERVYGPALWRSDPDRCCEIRKVEPMRRVLTGAGAWVTAIRREQSTSRARTPFVAWDARFEVTKIAPLAAWSRTRVLEYAIAHDVPVNELHYRGYPSIGCVQCTRRVEGAAAGDYSRAGRWSDQSKTECGLHLQETTR